MCAVDEAHNAARARLYRLIEVLAREGNAPRSILKGDPKSFEAILKFVKGNTKSEFEFLNDLTTEELDAMTKEIAEFYGKEVPE